MGVTQTMSDEDLLNRIGMNPNVLVGKPVVRGTRLAVQFIVNLMAHSAGSRWRLHGFGRGRYAAGYQ